MKMSGMLDEIIAHKKEETRRRQERYPIRLLEESMYFSAPTVSLCQYLARPELAGVIAEIKRKSPSRGVLQRALSVEKLSLGYMRAGASALSILTDEKYFGGSNDDLRAARRCNWCPILRKDFIVDEYQLYEARAIGADVVLLIAAALSPAKQRELAASAAGLGLEVLLEIHSREELDKAPLDAVHLVGVNNRNLSDLSVDLSLSEELAEFLPKNLPWVAESGISSAEEVMRLRKLGYRGFLIGESFLRKSRPELACASLVTAVRNQMEQR